VRKVNLWVYNENSEGAKALANLTGFKRIKRQGSKYKSSADKIIINWGDSVNFPRDYLKAKVLNNPAVVGAVTNKLKFFELMSGDCRMPEWTSSPAEAVKWVQNDLKTIVVCRTVLTGHSGNGIILYSYDDFVAKKPLPKAPLYTKYVPKKTEFRIHFFDGKVIDVQEKRKRQDVPKEEANFKIRNHQNGFVYCRENIVIPADVENQAAAVIAKCGLDFGAIDLIYNEKNKQAFVLEVNTAPGLEGTSVESYANAIKAYAEAA
jgi:glutathione synthase/RimK-type ligase-like ATP-grasp enzyme